MSKATPARPLSKGRKPLAAFCCESCGFTELYGLAYYRATRSPKAPL